MGETAATGGGRAIRWVTTTQDDAWVEQEPVGFGPVTGMPNVFLDPEHPQQRIDGIGGCFNELGWDALALLPDDDRETILADFFAPGAGLNLSLCRMPVGANDFSRDWYSYDEVDGDFALEHFSIDHDRETLVPFIRAAQRHQPELRLWASPWSPPVWMKRNGHYACAQPGPFQNAENGLRPEQVALEGTDTFRLEPPYLDAYARYFGAFIDAYAAEGIAIEMVMPQNEFNSPQVFPSCTWTPPGLAAFVAELGPQMARRDVRVFLGTQERPHDEQVEQVLADPDAGAHIAGVGFQWAGKGSIGPIHHAHPELELYQTEQECGDGRNDWRFCRHAWSLMKHFFGHGVTSYAYWNLALLEGGVSRWGWAQNSLVVVDPDARTARFTHEYHLLKHVAHFLQPDAVRIPTFSWTGHENQLAFQNPDGSIVVVVANEMAEPMTMSFLLAGELFTPTLPADSFSTFVIPAG